VSGKGRHYFAFSFSNEGLTPVNCKAAKLYGFLEHDNKKGQLKGHKPESFFPPFFSSFLVYKQFGDFCPIYISNLHQKNSSSQKNSHFLFFLEKRKKNL
jgi:hypothetical protein